MSCIVICGNLVSGFKVYGPYENADVVPVEPFSDNESLIMDLEVPAAAALRPFASAPDEEPAEPNPLRGIIHGVLKAHAGCSLDNPLNRKCIGDHLMHALSSHFERALKRFKETSDVI